MAVRKVAVSLPEELFDLVERARAVEHRTRSEVIQEALRTHFGEAVYVPSAEEREALLVALDATADSRPWSGPEGAARQAGTGRAGAVNDTGRLQVELDDQGAVVGGLVH